jgi:hypothetical protein
MMISEIDKKETICLELSDQLDNISTHASMLCSSTHDRKEVEKDIDHIIDLVEKLDDIVKHTKNNFVQWKQIIESN